MRTLTLLISFIILNTENRNEKIEIGESFCNVSVSINDKSVATIFSIHGDEETAVKAISSLPKENQFNFIKLEQSGKRTISFAQNGKILSFDPNRIFSDKGIKETLEKYNGIKFSQQDEKTVDIFANSLLKIVKRECINDYIITSHNNKDGNEGKGSVSILIYNDSKYDDSKDIAKCFISKNSDPDDFVLVTREDDFQFFKKNNVNVALFKKNTINKDGSLSVYCIENNIPYINIEAQHGHLKEQRKLLILTYDLMHSKKNKVKKIK